MYCLFPIPPARHLQTAILGADPQSKCNDQRHYHYAGFHKSNFCSVFLKGNKDNKKNGIAPANRSAPDRTLY
jgi:hypothetical protein